MSSTKFETVDQCPICGSTEQKQTLICKDYLVSETNFTLVDCVKCGFRFTNPRPAEEEIHHYYQSDKYISHNDEGEGFVNSLYKVVRSYTLKKKELLICRFAGQPKSLLDIGCGTGAFLETCKKEGWVVAGVETDPDARKVSAAKLNDAIHKRLADVSVTTRFDIITMWHVMEHIHRLDELWKQVKQLIQPSGHFVVAVPNADSFDAHYFKEHWAAYDVPRHLYHFTPISMEQLATNHGFKLIETRAMPFDAFYIALLSTQYAEGQTNYLESSRVGIISNWKARHTNYTSSVTYVFKRNDTTVD